MIPQWRRPRLFKYCSSSFSNADAAWRCHLALFRGTNIPEHHWRKAHTKEYFAYYLIDECEWIKCPACKSVGPTTRAR